MPNPENSLDKEIKKQMEEMRDDEIPEIDIEMSIQRRFPEQECDVIPHDGEPGVKQGRRLTVMQAIKLQKLAAAGDPDWVMKQRLEDARAKLREQKTQAPTPERNPATAMTPYEEADKLFYKEYFGAASSGDAGMRYGYERIPVSIYMKLMRPGVETKRKGLKWDTLTPSEFQTAFHAMAASAEAAKKRALAHMRNKDPR